MKLELPTISRLMVGSVSIGLGGILCACDGGSSSGAPPSASAAYLIPYSITYTGTPADGLYTVASDAPSASSQQVMSGTVGFFATVLEKALTDADGQIYQSVPDTAFFTLSPPPYSNDPAQVYKLDLRKTSGVPVATPIGNITHSDPECGFGAAELTANDPSSAIILDARGGTDGQCYTSDDVVYLSRASDSAVTAVTETPITTAGLINVSSSVNYICCTTAMPVYDADSLGMTGIIYRDVANNLLFSDPLFANKPTTLLSGITTFSAISSGPGAVFVIAGTAGAASLYRIGSNGSISPSLHDFQPSSFPQVYFSTWAVEDRINGNLWFSDNGAAFSSGNFYSGHEESYNVELLRAPLSGASPAEVIYSESGALPPTFANSYYTVEPRFAESMLTFTVQPFFAAYDFNNGVYTSPAPATLYTLPLDAAAGTLPQMIATLNGQIGVAAVHDGRIFTSNELIDATGNMTGTEVVVFSLDGANLKSLPDTMIVGSSEQLRGSIRAPQYTKPLLYIASYPTGSLPNTGGAELYSFSTANFTQTAVSYPDGSPYVQQGGESDDFGFSLSNLLPVDYWRKTSQGLALLDVSNNRWISVTNNANQGGIQPLWNARPNLGDGYLF